MHDRDNSGGLRIRNGRLQDVEAPKLVEVQMDLVIWFAIGLVAAGLLLLDQLQRKN